jgi:hypothetical protein
MIVKLENTDTKQGLRARLAHWQTDSPLFLHLEGKFDKFIEKWGTHNELNEMYFSDDAIFTRKGAILQAIEHIFDVMDMEELTQISTESNLLDFESQWQA